MKLQKEAPWWRSYAFADGEEHPALCYELARRTVLRSHNLPPWPQRSLRWRLATIRRFRPLLLLHPFEAVEFSEVAPLQLIDLPGWSTLTAMRVNLKQGDSAIVRGFVEWLKSERKALRLPNPPRNKGARRNWKPWAQIEILDAGDLDGDHSKSSKRSKARRLLPEQWLTREILSVFQRSEPKKGVS